MWLVGHLKDVNALIFYSYLKGEKIRKKVILKCSKGEILNNYQRYKDKICCGKYL